MTAQLEAARNVLKNLYRHSLKDISIGDQELCWTVDAKGVAEPIASGYAGRTVSISVRVEDQWISFEGSDAKQLVDLGKRGQCEYN